MKESKPLTDLPRLEARFTYLYVEHATVGRDDGAVTLTDDSGVASMPAAMLTLLMLGPGTRITHAAMSLLAETGTSVVWTGEMGVRCYGSAMPASRSSRLLIKQATLASNERGRLAAARRMYSKRFPGEDISGLTMRALLGREGTRVRQAYEQESVRTGVKWNGRSYKVDDWDDADDINKALTATVQCLYGVVHAAIVALGLAPGLGFVHTGEARSFVYDIADLYRTEIAVPLAFDLVATGVDDIGTAARRAMRDRFAETRIMGRIVNDIRSILEPDAPPLDIDDETMHIWAGRGVMLEQSVNRSPESKQ